MNIAEAFVNSGLPSDVVGRIYEFVCTTRHGESGVRAISGIVEGIEVCTSDGFRKGFMLEVSNRTFLGGQIMFLLWDSQEKQWAIKLDYAPSNKLFYPGELTIKP